MLNYLCVYCTSFKSQNNPVGNMSLNPKAHEQSKAAIEMFESYMPRSVSPGSFYRSHKPDMAQ